MIIIDGRKADLHIENFANLEEILVEATTECTQENRIVTMDALCRDVWGDNLYGYENSLMAHIRRIREKIEKDPSSPALLVTVKGLGYKLNI